MDINSPFISETQLFENLDNPALIILDTSLKNPVKAEATIGTKLIPKSLRFDWEKFSDLSNPLPHTMPNAVQFTKAAQELGINANSLVVVYDRVGLYSSPRVWWMFLAMGFEKCYILNGGLPEWIKMGYPVVAEHEEPKQKGDFLASYKDGLISSKEDVLVASTDKSGVIIDARSSERFNGKVAEPRVGLRSGHIPNAINIPFEKVLFENKLRSKKELEKIFSSIGDKNTSLIFSCGSGVTACIDALAATVIGYQNISIYDGSWSEWGLQA